MALHLIIGKSKCGKSEYAEAQLAKCTGKSLYIGTLPNILLYRETIKIHQERRPIDWGCLELSGDPVADFSFLLDGLMKYDNILMDGIALYLLRITNNFKLVRLHDQLIWMVDLAAKKKGEIFIVDHIVPENFPRKEKCFLRDIHQIISRKSNTIVIYSNNFPHIVTKQELLRFERSMSKTNQ